MSRYVCKWCGKEFSYAPEKTDGWVTCSENCRQQLAGSVTTGKTEANHQAQVGGCVGFIAIAAFIICVLVATVQTWMKDDGMDDSNTVQTEQIDNDNSSTTELESALSEPEPEAVPEPEVSVPESADEETVPQEPVSGEPVEPVETVTE